MNKLQYGSRGDEVKRLQQELMKAGYNVGSTKDDGVFGNNTQSAVMQYQTDKGLAADGIAGEQTLASLYNLGAPQQPQIPEAALPQGAQQQDTQTPNIPAQPTSTPISSAAYQQALAALQAAESKAPTYANSYGGQLLDVYNKITNRDKFSYDINSDMLYQQYRDQYAQQGQMAMKDTLGQAAALTGGYGSSYGQAVGQQQYDAYLQRLNEVIPDLYGMAQDAYTQEGADLYKQYGLLGDMADDEYGKYADEYNRWLTERNYLQGQADDAWKRDYALTSDNREHIMYLIKASGYNPTDDELSAAGMTREQADALRNRYLMENGLLPTGGGSGGGSGYGGGGGGYDGGAPTPDVNDKLYNNNKKASEIESDAAAYFSSNPTVELDSMTLDYWLQANGYSGDSARLFKAYLQSMGAGLSSRAGGAPTTPKTTTTKATNRAKSAKAGQQKHCSNEKIRRQ